MNILFLCTGNSCRSQMAEGWARHFGGDLFQVQSAGIEMHGKNPRAIDVMREAGGEVMAAFRESRDDIRLRIEDLIHRLSDKLGQEHND